MGYAQINSISQKNKVEQEAEIDRVKQETKVNLYKNCATSAFNIYSKQWDGECSLLSRGPNCALPSDKAKSLDQDREKNEDQCLKLYQ